MKFKIAFIISIFSLMLLICACGETEKIPATWTKDVDGADFVIEFAEGQDITILQLADIQLYPWQNLRTPGLKRSAREERIVLGISDDMELTAWQYIEESINKVKPDLIVLTGDNIAGTADDSGEIWADFVERFDSYGIPWVCVFGNHDNESHIGVDWQVEQLLNSRYGIFANGDVTGNGNYNILIKQGDEYKYLFYVVDTHGEYIEPDLGVDHIDYDIPHAAYIYDDQVDWVKDSAENVYAEIGENLPVLVFQHIPVTESVYAVQNIYPDTYADFPFYATNDGDLGMATEAHSGIYNERYWSILKEIGCVGMFFGHQHEIATSIVYDGIRLTYGLKSSFESYFNPDMIGCTEITIKEKDNSFKVEYHYTDIGYPSGE